MFTLKPDIKKDKFTVEEDCILMAAVAEYGTTFTKFPMHLLPGRTMVQIRNRYRNVLCNVGQRKGWTIEADGKLMDEVQRLGTAAWSEVSKIIGFHRVSCRSRYNTIVNFLKRHPTLTFHNVPRRSKEMSTSVTADNWMDMIIDAKSQPIKAPNGICPTLKNANQRYYDFFKYSYDFQYDPNWDCTDAAATTNPATIQQLSQILDVQTSSSSSVGVEEDKIGISHISSIEFNAPTNWSSALLLRGLTIMTKIDKDLPPKKCRTDCAALRKFRNRFKALILNAMMMSKCIGAVGTSTDMVVADEEAAAARDETSFYMIETNAGTFQIQVVENDVKQIQKTRHDGDTPEETTANPAAKRKKSD